MNDTHARPIVPEDLMAIKSVADVQLSPDGRHVAYVLTEISLEEDSYRSTIWIAPATGGPPVQLTRGPGRDSAPRWSPDGLSLAFLSDRGGGRPQMFLLPMTGGEPRRLTAAGHGAGPASWSPDGTKVVFAATAPKEHAPAGKAESHWAHRPRVVSRAQYKADGVGYTFDACSQLFALCVGSGTFAQLTSGDQESRAPAWSPDGTQIAFSRARSGVADFSLFDIWTVDADGGSSSRLTESIGRATSPTWSPDGAMIACYGTDAQEPGYGDPMTRVWLVPASGGAARTLTAEYDRSVVLLPPPAVTPGPVWSADGDSVTFVAADAGNAHVVRAEVSTAAVRTVVGGERQVLSASAGEGAGRIAFAASDPHLPSDVFTCRWDGGDEQRLTRINVPELSQWALPRVGRRAFSVPDHGTVEGWLFQPSAGAGAAPLLVDIHGGPASFHGNVFSAGYFYRYVLASRGWAVLALNPTGSGSYGKAFAHGIRGRWGERDLPEQISAVDALVAEGTADDERLAVAGYSYGGFMTSWAVAHTDRFKAAVVGAPVVNLESFHGTADIGMWFAPWEMRGDLATHREVYRRLSPINYVDRVTTPTLILHGEADDRCPIGQGEELFIGLIASGKAPAEFVRYPGGSHLFLNTGRPSHRLDVTARIVAWLEKHVTAKTYPKSYGTSRITG